MTEIFRAVSIRQTLIILIFAGISVAHAKVFDFKSKSVAPYFKASAGIPAGFDAAYSQSSGAQTQFAKSSTYLYGAEIGALMDLFKELTFRVGVEILSQKTPSNLEGVNSAGSNLLNLSSTLLIYSPVVGLEYNFYSKTQSRAFFSLTANYASASLDNAYTLTSAGMSQYGLSNNYTESSQSTAVGGKVGLGFESLISDMATLHIEAGYRYLPLSAWSYKNSGQGLQGNFTQGQSVTNNDGSSRSVNLSGLTLSVGLRFYID